MIISRINFQTENEIRLVNLLSTCNLNTTASKRGPADKLVFQFYYSDREESSYARSTVKSPEGTWGFKKKKIKKKIKQK